MVPVIEKPAVTHRQKRAALAIAGMADFLQIMVFPAFGWGAASPAQDALDIFVAFLLMAICGFRWQWVLAFCMELVPGLDLLPTWTMVVALMPVRGEQPDHYVGFEVEELDDDGPVRVTRVDRNAPDVVDVHATVVPPVRHPAPGTPHFKT
jgi:hypothetical protein